jgi:hypothetical protein
MSTGNFAEACNTYRFLRENGYPEKATLKLVGDRHRLSRLQRNCLFRGVTADLVAHARTAKIVAAAHVSGHALGLDWYNVLITVESYLKGQVLFVADDGMVRDAAAAHGSYRTSPLTARAITDILDILRRIGPARIDVYVDMPIAYSGLMAEDLRRRLASVPCPSEVTVAASADYPLKAYAGIVASSDSAILDASTRVLDLARAVLAVRFAFTPLRVHELFPESHEPPPQ